MRALGVFTRLLARSGTGQPVTTYTSLYRRPAPGKRIHVILVDNGRSEWLADARHRNMLKCLPLRRLHEHLSPSTGVRVDTPTPTSSPGRWASTSRCCAARSSTTATSRPARSASCSGVCPAKIDLGEQIYLWRQQLDALHLADPTKKAAVKGMDFVMAGPGRFYGAIACARAAEKLPRGMVENSLNPWSAPGRAMPRFARETFNAQWKRGAFRKDEKKMNSKDEILRKLAADGMPESPYRSSDSRPSISTVPRRSSRRGSKRPAAAWPCCSPARRSTRRCAAAIPRHGRSPRTSRG